MTFEELQAQTAPFRVVSVHDGHEAIITGFTKNDPLGVGGGMLPPLATVYFEGGGWLLVVDLLKHFNLPLEET
jgi:hypothetical protein